MDRLEFPSFRLLPAGFSTSFLCFFAVCCGIFFAPDSALAKPRFGLWVEAEGTNQPFKSQGDFSDFLKFASDWEFTDLYCQVYRGGRSWFPSMMADDEPFRVAYADGFDPLDETIRAGHARGQKVHAWINALRINENAQAPLMRVVGRKAALVDTYGNSLLDYNQDVGTPPGVSTASGTYRLGTPGIWLDASDPAVRDYLIESIREVVLRYPKLDGIHLDMIRFPHAIGGPSREMQSRPEFGYSAETIRRFYRTAGKQPPVSIDRELMRKLGNSLAWQSWRRAQVTILVFEIREMLEQLHPGMELSAAVVAEPERAYDHAFQDWAGWANRGIVDYVLPMNYTNEQGTFSSRNTHALTSVPPSKVIMGLGAWLMIHSPAQLTQQGRIALKGKAAGVVLFSYSNLFSENGRKTLSFFDNSLFGGSQLAAGN